MERKFYHGTQKAIHLTDKPYLDPNLAVGGDIGDPEGPHVFVTPDKTMAMIYSLKAPNAIANSINGKTLTMVFYGEPKVAQGGWVYECPENPVTPFQEVFIDGQSMGRWFGKERVEVVNPQAIPNLEQVMRDQNLQVLVVDDQKITFDDFMDRFKSEGRWRAELPFFKQMLADGVMTHFNVYKGINPDPCYVPDIMQTALEQFHERTPPTEFIPTKLKGSNTLQIT